MPRVPNRRFARAAAALALALAACQDPPTCRAPAPAPPALAPSATATTPPAPDASSATEVAATATTTWWRPKPSDRWRWQLTGTLATSDDAEALDVDLFDTATATVASLHAAGRRVVCYFSAGSLEDWRPDCPAFGDDVLGRPVDGWKGERWLDVRDARVRDALAARLDLAKAKGCDAVEPDNTDAWDHASGLGIDRADQLAFDAWLVAQAHARGLGIAAKNPSALAGERAALFDFALDEQCHQEGRCAELQPFVAAGLAVWNAEYAATASAAAARAAAICPSAKAQGLRTLVLPLALDGSFVVACD